MPRRECMRPADGFPLEENVVRFDLPVGSLLDDPGASPTMDFCSSSRGRWLSGAGNLPTARQIQVSIGAM